MVASNATTKAAAAVQSLPGAVAQEVKELKRRQGKLAKASRLMLIGVAVALMCTAFLSHLHAHWLPTTSISEPALPSSLVDPVRAIADAEARAFQTLRGAVIETLTGGIAKVIVYAFFVAGTAIGVLRQSYVPALAGIVMVGAINGISMFAPGSPGESAGEQPSSSSPSEPSAFQWTKAVSQGDYENLKIHSGSPGAPGLRALVLGQAAVIAVHGKLADLTPEQRAHAVEGARYALAESAAKRLTVAPATLYALQKAGQVSPLSPQALEYETGALRRAAGARSGCVASIVVAVALLCAAAGAGGLGHLLSRRTRRIDQLLKIPRRQEDMAARDDFTQAFTAF